MINIEKFEIVNGTITVKANIKTPYDSLCYIKEVTIYTPYTGSGVNIYPNTYLDPEDDPETQQLVSFDRNVTFSDVNIEEGEEDLIVVKITAVNPEEIDLPCGVKLKRESAVLFPKGMYQYAISLIKNIGNDCSNTQAANAFNDFMLRYKAVELAVKSCDISNAIEYYKKFFAVNPAGVSDAFPYSYTAYNNALYSGGCGCGHY